MKTSTVIAALMLWAALLPQAAFPADEDRLAEQVKQDLAKLQGKWETTIRGGGKSIRNVQTIKGTTSTVERFNEQGVLLHSHTADFKLSVKGQVRVFTFFDLRVTAGPQAGKGFKGPLSFVYVVTNDVWTEARGLLIDQKDGNPRMMNWKRIVEDKVAQRDGWRVNLNPRRVGHHTTRRRSCSSRSARNPTAVSAMLS